jgi:hypothetical protein
MSNTNDTGAVATRNGTALAVPDEIAEKYPALDREEFAELKELMAENFTDGEAMSVKNLTMVKIPSGSSAAVFGWEDNGESESAKELEGVICAWQNRRNYWESEEVTGEAPDCSSRDGKIGVGLFGVNSSDNPSGLCEDCPMGQWTEVNGKRVPAPCKPQQALLFIVEGEVFPWYIQVPRTSMGNFKKYRADLLKARKGVAQVLTKLSLSKVVGKDRNVPDYFEIKFVRGDDLGKAAKQAALEVGAAMLPILNQVQPVTSAADTDNVVPGEGGVSIDDAPVDEAPKEAAPA